MDRFLASPVGLRGRAWLGLRARVAPAQTNGGLGAQRPNAPSELRAVPVGARGKSPVRCRPVDPSCAVCAGYGKEGSSAGAAGGGARYGDVAGTRGYRALRGGLGRVPQCFRRPAGARKLDCSAWSFSSCSALKLVRQPQLQPPTDDVLVPPRICLMGWVDAVSATVRADVVGPTVPASRPARTMASEMRLDAKPVGGGPASFLAPCHGGCPLRTLCP